jgi:tetratricopeptide (TPR) repeat protein
MRLLALAAVAMMVALSRPAFADERADRARALELFEKSEQAYREGRFQEAIDRLLEARRLKHEPVLLYNLARAYEALGDRKNAADAYEAYLQEEPFARDQGAIQGRITTLRRQEAEAAAQPRARPSSGLPPGQSPTRPEPPPHRSPNALPWVVAAFGVAGVGSGVFFGVLANTRHDDAAAARIQSDAQTQQDDAKRLATIANVAFVAGGALLVAGVTWGIVDLNVSAGPRSVALRGTF